MTGVTKASGPTQVSKGGGLGGIDAGLAVYFFFWYLGNYYYNIVNKRALTAAGGECRARVGVGGCRAVRRAVPDPPGRSVADTASGAAAVRSLRKLGS